MTAYVPAYKMSLVREGSVVLEHRPRLESPKDVFALLNDVIPDDGREHFVILMVDARRRLVGVVPIAIGGMMTAAVHPRDVFGAAIVHKAAAIILCHNHPSGEPEPSNDDVALTRRMVSAGALLNIEVYDHVVVGSGSRRAVSFRERGLV